VIVVEDLTKVYAGAVSAETVALQSISITITDGEYVAIMGPSGSGKTTLMNILGCLDTASSGSYRLDGQEVSSLSDDDLADIRNLRIGFVFQSFNLLPRATAVRNVLAPLLYSSMRKSSRIEAAEAALEAAGLPQELWHHRSNELSGGQMQRVAIARALVTGPGLILADEPTGNLDTSTGEHILDTFRRLHERGRTILLITHEQAVAEHAGRVIHIHDGAVLAELDSATSPVQDGGGARETR